MAPNHLLHCVFANVGSRFEEQGLLRGHLAEYNIRYRRLSTPAYFHQYLSGHPYRSQLLTVSSPLEADAACGRAVVSLSTRALHFGQAHLVRLVTPLSRNFVGAQENPIQDLGVSYTGLISPEEAPTHCTRDWKQCDENLLIPLRSKIIKHHSTVQIWHHKTDRIYLFNDFIVRHLIYLLQ